MYGGYNSGYNGNSGSSLFTIGKIVVALGIALFSYCSYQGTVQTNPVTGEKQHVAMSTDQEIAVGLQSAPSMIQQYGGEASEGADAERVQRIGAILVSRTEAADSPYKFGFHLLNDQKTVNAFALPGGQVFITEALLMRLQTEGQVAGVLGHEMGHVIARHGAQQLAKSRLTQGLAGAANVATYDPNRYGSRGMMAEGVAQLLNLKYGRNDELEADHYGVLLSAKAGYDPRAMLGVMKVLEDISKSGRTPEILSTHPNPGNRAEKIKSEIEQAFPQGIPSGLLP